MRMLTGFDDRTLATSFRKESSNEPCRQTLQCSDCGTSFTFSAEEQDFFATKGYTNEPKRCQLAARQREHSEMALAVVVVSEVRDPSPDVLSSVAECGVETQVPFEPAKADPCIAAVATTR